MNQIHHRTVSDVAIQVEHVTKKFTNQVALDHISFNVQFGSVCVLLGPNGAGKSTLLNLLIGSMRPTSGDLSVLDNRPGSQVARRQTGVMLQISGIPQTLSVTEHISAFQSYYPQPLSLDEIVQKSQLEGLENKNYGTLSVGQKQRLHFALAICGRPSLLLLDEPSSSLDVHSRFHLWDQIDALKESGTTLVISTHDFQEAERLASQVIVLHKGKIILNGTPEDLRYQFAETRISITSSLEPNDLFKLPQVKRIERHGDTIELFVNEVENTIRFVLENDRSAGLIEIKRSTVEDAYLHLLSEKVRNG